MLLEKALIRALRRDAAVTELVEDRIAIDEPRPEAQAMPDLYVLVDKSSYQQSLDGSHTDLQTARIELIARSMSGLEAATLCASAVLAIEAAKGITLTAGDESARVIEAVWVEDPGSGQGADSVTLDGTERAVLIYSAILTVQYRPDGSAAAISEDDEPAPPRSTPTFRREEIVLTTQMAAARSVTLARTPDLDHPVIVTPRSGCDQFRDVDFRVIADAIVWNQPSDGLYGILVGGDVILVTYHA